MRSRCVLPVVFLTLLGSSSLVFAASTNTTAASSTSSSAPASGQKGSSVLSNQTEQEVKQSVQKNTITQGTGIMVVDPDTLVAAKYTDQNSVLQSGGNTASMPQPSPRVTNGLQTNQSQNLLSQVDASGGITPPMDPDVVAAQSAAQSVSASTPTQPNS